jgi:Region found in RelA / SpoT proteins
MKDRDHLRDKLFRKMAEARAKGRAFDITSDNLLQRINDLAGIRILHLYTRQVRDIDPALRAVLVEQQYALREEPFARTWDDEYREFFESCGLRTEPSRTMYTSVHYVVGSASRTIVTCEIQVRTLMEEVWGQVDHSMNYPDPIDASLVENNSKSWLALHRVRRVLLTPSSLVSRTRSHRRVHSPPRTRNESPQRRRGARRCRRPDLARRRCECRQALGNAELGLFPLARVSSKSSGSVGSP